MVAKLLIGAVLLSFAAPAYADDWDFVLVNKTGKPIKLVEVSESGKAAWVKEVLDEDAVHGAIKPGENHTVHFTREPKSCAFDVRMTFQDDTQGVWSNFNVCNFAFGDFAFKGDLPVVKGS